MLRPAFVKHKKSLFSAFRRFCAASADRRICPRQKHRPAAFAGEAFYAHQRQLIQVRQRQRLQTVQALMRTEPHTERAGGAFIRLDIHKARAALLPHEGQGLMGADLRADPAAEAVEIEARQRQNNMQPRVFPALISDGFGQQPARGEGLRLFAEQERETFFRLPEKPLFGAAARDSSSLRSASSFSMRRRMPPKSSRLVTAGISGVSSGTAGGVSSPSTI